MEPDPLKPLKILVVEDESTSRTLLKALLCKSQLIISEIQFAETLKVTFELLDNNVFDVVLLDLNLPDSVGLGTLLKVTRKHPSIAIVVITGMESEEIGLKAIAVGAQEYLIKGRYNLETLSKSIRYSIERKLTRGALDRKQRNLEAIFDAAPVGMLLVDENLQLNVF